ncbi:3-oxo-tetronate 4-phosphate decarboxylase [Nitratireductor kimnyeongensis]|uniref:3-oxo-tetronate 4-phosphate decarboxylase n=1 Tax=Nitratireductor kimnyeongensis TaxID=430679 RepID=A0ABW0T6L2_9HYPH|nr:3-oxo-tetronate 4-phosphate decarboxylase [Nitratireductor kimnyeongensis]QZZ34051.1 aldolase [Nitratireductor kimnyeongensis]
MSEEARLREEMAFLAKSLYDRGLTHGSTGNISARLSDGSLLVTPTGSSLGMLDPARISRLDADFNHVDGDRPTKEVPLHSAFYETRQAQTGAVVHLHSTHSVALSVLPETDPDNVLPPITPYSLMQLGKVKLLPYFMPGDAAMGEAVKGLAGKHSAVLLANHGPVVAAKNLKAAVFAMEELEATARLVLLTRGMNAKLLSEGDVAELTTRYPPG